MDGSRWGVQGRSRGESSGKRTLIVYEENYIETIYPEIQEKNEANEKKKQS